MKDIKQCEDVSEERMAQIIFTEHMFLFHLGFKSKSALMAIDNAIDSMIRSRCTKPKLSSYPNIYSYITDGAAEYLCNVRKFVKTIEC